MAKNPTRPRKDNGNYYNLDEIIKLTYNHPKRKQYREWYNSVKQKNSGESTADETKKKKKVTNDNIERSNLEQHILTQNIDKAANYFMSHRDMFNYRTFRQINGDVALMVNKLRGINNLDIFYRIKSSVLSLMVPKIKIFKVSYEGFVEGPDGLPDAGTISPLKEPCYREIRFSDNFGIETASSVQDYLAYEGTKPSWRNVGLKSFEFDYNGETAGMIQNDITADLNLTFKSLKDLQASPPGEPPPEKGGIRYSDLITWAPHMVDKDTELYDPRHYELRVFLGYTAPTQEQLRHLNLSEKDIQTIKNIEKLNIILSLTLQDYTIDIKDDGQVSVKANYRGGLRTATGSNAVNIFQSTFKLTNGGRVDISKKVNAKHNISSVYKLRTTLASIQRGLKSPSCKDHTCVARKNLKGLVETDQFLAAILKDGWSMSNMMLPHTGILMGPNGEMKVKGDGEEMFAFFKEATNVNKMLAFIKQKIGLFRKDIYKTFVDQLIDGNTDPGAHGTRLFCIEAGSMVVEESLGVIIDDDPRTLGLDVEDIAGEEEAVADELRKRKKVTIDRCHRVGFVDPSIRAAVLSDIDTAVSEASKSKDDKAEEEKEPHKDPARASVRDFSGESYKFYFVYLGDIIELACKNAELGKLNLKSDPGIYNEGHSVFSEGSYFPDDQQTSTLDYPLKNARILLGPIEYYDSKHNLNTINLAQLPISFNSFRAWFMKHVVRRQRFQMPLNAFITSLMRDLVMPALGVGMPRSYRAPKTNSSMVALTLPGKQNKNAGQERMACGLSLARFSAALPMKQIIDTDSAEFEQEYLSVINDPVPAESLVKTSYQYSLIYVTTRKSFLERQADPLQDIKDGIYHFNIGSDMGLLKSMKFEKNNIGDLAEMRFMQSQQQGIDALDQLKFPYHTSLTLIGNSLFVPGMYYYVNPSLAGLGSIEQAGSLAYKMNLGGYHLVTRVITKVSSGKFETNLVGRQTGQKKR